jgi:hypothetical protein
MTTEKHDPWALLREARDQLVGVQGMGRVTQTIARIDAALAERQDSATPVVEPDAVEWRDCLSVDESMFLAAALSDKLKVSVYTEEATPGVYPWRAVRIEAREGTAPTLEDAKSAAIEAARGMK